MLSNFNNSLELLEVAQKEQLYQNLLVQLEKDFGLANVPFKLHKDILPSELKSLLHEKIYVLMVEKFQEYLNLLYVVDIPEEQVRNMPLSDVVDLSAEVSFLLLKREWQKVWYRHKYHT
ncbi:MAG: hypothetical protein NXH86_13735 [Flavobacteriaceae bacterium]|jgi:hypothetical protein|uniref:hypothetical protein n=1 Tax=Flagellimonas TaxID=444459 RepID=UPI000E287D3B|nr:hypothetical protein [Flavobacteriaceae bacterium]